MIELGYNYALQNKDSIAQINYQKAIDFVKESPPYAYIVGQVFSDYNLLDEAVTVYETAMMQDDSRNYYAQLARIYGEQGELEKMFETYVELFKKTSKSEQELISSIGIKKSNVELKRRSYILLDLMATDQGDVIIGVPDASGTPEGTIAIWIKNKEFAKSLMTSLMEE